MKREALRVTSTIPVAPTTLYFAWIDSDHHSSMTGATAKIDPVVGAKYSTCNGYVTGKLVILDLGRRIVMSWRTTDFPRDAADSRVEVHFETLGASTRILILHTEIPEGQSEKYKALWNEKYITPMRAYFSKFLPDPRNPPVRRIPPPPPEGDDEDEEEEDMPVKGKGKLGMKPSKAAPPPKPASSGPGVHKADSKPAKIAAKAPAPKAPAPKAPAPKAPPPKAPAAKALPPKGKPAKAAAKPAAKKAPPAKKPAAKKAPSKPAKKPAAKPKKKR
jgi:uncharacterized protein YndB with AHSA1/START domain